MPASKSKTLQAYRDKRSANRTPEPSGSAPRPGSQQFVVQQHAARNLHFDLRLELDGVLKSWAVPKGPSPNPADKRLAVHVEDHPLEYANFEGRIPEGNYGAGAVIVWDRGRWIPLNDPTEGLDKGKLLFELRGYKLRGKQDWLLIKERDAYVSEQGTHDYAADSVLSGRTVTDVLEERDLSKPIRRKLQRLRAKRARVDAGRVESMLAQPGEPFSN